MTGYSPAAPFLIPRMVSSSMFGERSVNGWLRAAHDGLTLSMIAPDSQE